MTPGILPRRVSLRSATLVSLASSALLLTVFVVQMPKSSAYATPGTGVIWTMDDLVANSGGAVVLISPANYLVNEVIVITATDTVSVSSGESVYMANAAAWNVVGRFDVGSTPPEARILGANPIPLPGDWAGIGVQGGGVYIRNATIQHGIVGVAVDGICEARNATITDVREEGVKLVQGSLELSGSSVHGGTSDPLGPAASALSLSGTNTGPIKIEYNVLIAGGNGLGNNSGGNGINASGFTGVLLIRGNSLIRGGSGGGNSGPWGAGGLGGTAVSVSNFTYMGATPTVEITGNAWMQGGGGAMNTGDDGLGGGGGAGIFIDDAPPLGKILVTGNGLIEGGAGGRNTGNATAGDALGGGGGAGLVLRDAEQASQIFGNTLIRGGRGGDNDGFGTYPLKGIAGRGGIGIEVQSTQWWVLSNSTVAGGRGGDNGPDGVDSQAGPGGNGVYLWAAGLNLSDSNISGGPGGEFHAAGGTMGRRAGVGGGGIAVWQGALNLLNTTSTGGRGGDNFAQIGFGGGGGVGLLMMPATSVSTTRGLLQGGRGGDNRAGARSAGYGGSGVVTWPSISSILIEGTEVFGGAGGDIVNGTGAGGTGGDGIYVDGLSGIVQVWNSPNIATGNGGLNKSLGSDGQKGRFGLVLLGAGGAADVRGNVFTNAGYSAISSSVNSAIDNNLITDGYRGVSLFDSGANLSTVSNLVYSNATGTGIDINTAGQISLSNIDVTGAGGIFINGSRADLISGRLDVSDYGIKAWTSTMSVEDTIIVPASPSRSFELLGSSVTTLNSTFPYSDIQTIDSTSSLVVNNYLDILVRNLSLTPLAGADVHVLDNAAAIYASPGFGGADPQTDVAGRVSMTVTDRTYEGASSPTENATTAEVAYGPMTFGANPRAVNMSTSHFEYFTELLVDSEPPRILNMALQGTVSGKAGANDTITVTAILDDTVTGGNLISGANFTIGAKNWPSARVLQATDGVFDSPSENVSGNFSTATMPFGTTMICVYGEDSLMNANLTGACTPLFVDDRPPKIFSLMFNGLLPSITLTARDDINVTATVDDLMQGDSLVVRANVTVDGAFRASMSPLDGSFDSMNESVYGVMSTVLDANGPHTLCVNASDEVGNMAVACGSFTMFVDVSPPEVLNVLINGSSTFKTGRAMVRLTATVSDTMNQVAGANYTLGAGNWASSVPMSASDGAFDSAAEDVEGTFDTSAMAEGSHTFCVYAWDNLFNSNTTGACAVLVLDMTAPAGYSILFNGQVAPIAVVIGDPITVTAVADDTGRGDSRISSASIVNTTFSISAYMSASDGAFDSANESVFAVIPTFGVAPGSYAACVLLIDEFGNGFVDCGGVSIVDPFPPMITSVALNPALAGPAVSMVLSAIVDDFLEGGSIVSGANFTVGASNWSTSRPMVATDGAFDETMEVVQFTLDSNDFATGQYLLCVYAWDAVPNRNTTGSCVMAQIDRTGPAISLFLLNGAGPPITAGWDTSVQVTARLDEQFTTMIFRANITVDSTRVAGMTAADGAFNSNIENVLGNFSTLTLLLGVHTVCITATDFFGNIGTSCGSMMVADLSPPWIMDVTLNGQSTVSTPSGSRIEVKANITDIGFSDVASANMTLDHSWASSVALAAMDGAFDQVSESVNGTMSTSYQDLGGHTLCIYATDSDSNANTTGACVTFTIVVPPDVTPPIVQSHQPQVDGVGVALSTEIVITFSEPMNTAATESAVTMTPSVPHTKTWNGETLRIVPTNGFAYGTQYQVRVAASGAADLAGNHLDGDGDGTGGDDFTWSFTTEQVPPVTQGTDWMPLITAILVIAVVAITILLFLKRKKSSAAEGEVEEEEPEEDDEEEEEEEEVDSEDGEDEESEESKSVEEELDSLQEDLEDM